MLPQVRLTLTRNATIPQRRWVTPWFLSPGLSTVLHLCWQTAHNLSHQSLFLRSRCFPMSAGPLTKQRWRTLLFFKALHMKLPSLLSFPLPTLTLRVPWDVVPCPILMVGKHILIDTLACLCGWACVCVCSEPKWRCTQEWRSGTKAVSCTVFFAVGLMSHLSSQMDWDPGTPPESLAKTLMEGD